jgi:uncharacterized membrane protein
MYAKGDVAVSLRLLRALGDIASATPDQAVRATIYERGKRIVKGCAEKLGEEELRSLRLRLSAWEEHVEHQASSAVPVRQTEGPRHES